MGQMQQRESTDLFMQVHQRTREALIAVIIRRHAQIFARADQAGCLAVCSRLLESRRPTQYTCSLSQHFGEPKVAQTKLV